MGVVFKGGTSGMRADYKAPTPDSGQAQPVLRTENSSRNPGVHLNAERGLAPRKTDATSWTQATPDFMPTSCDLPPTDGGTAGTTDIADPNATQGPWGPGVNAVNTPYTGIK